MPSLFVWPNGTLSTRKPFFNRLFDFSKNLYMIIILYFEKTDNIQFDPQQAVDKYCGRTKNTNKGSERRSGGHSGWNGYSSGGPSCGRKIGSVDDIRPPPCGSCCGGI
ncbi:uncharacterized protein T551_00361 [Pneumocystis jirovecii RU7]|uniref:Uncharacterized protein n=1 Tax=Pneumocystis jirovecii (strain RU7) TaxID=1408657 RepID=A0A0W4ZV68_PNEJ7|nr:uncharacterized protein T551_00361 [Pneumocystis jirovecii RU7]KTW32270.1 hypothetical protein T551_00361 [Pneumocystis jirovecii RU7]